MTGETRKHNPHQRKILEEHYREVLYGRRITWEEVKEEIENLERKRDKGNLDDGQFHLASMLGLL
jgi:hypothetical protein